MKNLLLVILLSIIGAGCNFTSQSKAGSPDDTTKMNAPDRPRLQDSDGMGVPDEIDTSEKQKMNMRSVMLRNQSAADSIKK